MCFVDDFLFGDEIIINGFYFCESDEDDRVLYVSFSDWILRLWIGMVL